jgi:pimeloyl-ACP methyl ester carboxylesterase
MLASVRVPVLLTHHFRRVDPTTGDLLGALSDTQAARVRALLESKGVTVDYQSFPTMGHSMHGQDPKLFADTLIRWAAKLPA